MKKNKELTEENADVNIKLNFGQDEKRAKEHLKEMTKFLEPLKNAGLLEFKAVTFRKCDWCGKELKEGDRFETIGEKDKCEDCGKKKK